MPVTRKRIWEAQTRRHELSSGRLPLMPVSARTRFEVFKRDGFTCQYCGRNRDKDGVVLHVDHVVARAAGGSDDITNLITACRDCNLGKAAKPLDARAPAPDVAAQTAHLEQRRRELEEFQEQQTLLQELENDVIREPWNHWFTVWGQESLPVSRCPNKSVLLRYTEAIGVAEVKDAMDIAGRKFEWRIHYDSLRYFLGVCRRKQAQLEGRVVRCRYCNVHIVLTPEQAAQDCDWGHTACRPPEPDPEVGQLVADYAKACVASWDLGAECSWVFYESQIKPRLDALVERGFDREEVVRELSKVESCGCATCEPRPDED